MRKRLLLFFALVLISASVCFAEMTIYFKDGKEVKVHKIVFNGNQADLYLMDNTIMNVSVATIDLDVSGIGKPVGTYGETTVSGNRNTVVSALPMVNSATRQADLREEWENATIVATAKKDVGSIHKGDTVHANVSDASSKSSSASRQRYYWYDDDRGTYYGQNYNQNYNQNYGQGYQGYQNSQSYQPVTLDQAYMIIYKKADGTFGKKILDAASFAAAFDIQRPATPPKPLPYIPVEPQSEQRPAPEVKMPPEAEEVPASQQPVNEQPKETSGAKSNDTENQTAPQGKPVAPVPQTKSRAVAWVLASTGVAIVIACAILFYLRSKKKPFVDTSSFAQCERDLREFEIEIWLRHGKTMDQLTEICLKKFYQDQPAALNVAMKVAKRTPKNFVLPLLIKEAAVDSAQAEELYSAFESRISSVRRLVEDVSVRKGLPIKADVPQAAQTVTRPAAAITQPTMKLGPQVSAPPVPQVPVAASAGGPAPAVVVSQPSSVTSSDVEISLPLVLSDNDSGQVVRGDLPSYVTNVLDQLAFLSSVQRK